MTKTPKRIFYLTPDDNKPAGGIKVIYRHVDLLNQNGFMAFVLHKQPGFRCTWFANQTALAYLPETKLDSATDILVVPEIFGPRIAEFVPGVKKVIFNQNCYYTFSNYDLATKVTPYLDQKDVLGVLVVSADSSKYLQYTFPKLRIYRLINSIDTKLFKFNKKKKKQICFMPRKNTEDISQVLNILKYKGVLKDFKLAPILNLPEAQMLEIYKDSVFYLSSGDPEGCPAPPAEAMACGCYVIGYHGKGGKEFFKKEFCQPIERGEIIKFAKAVEMAINKLNKNPQAFARPAQKAAAFVMENYSLAKEKASVLKAWSEIIAK